jgi:hypothetical protein
MKDPDPCRSTGTVIFLYIGSKTLVGLGLLYEVPGSHTTHQSVDSSGREISSSQRSLPDNTQHSQQTKHPRSLRHANPQSQHASGLDLTPFTSVTLEPEQTQQSKPTFVWAYIARHVWLLLIRHVCPDS